MRTDELIALLAENARPARRLPPPSRRVASWLAVALPALAAMVLTISPRPDLAEKLTETRYLVEQGATVTTAILAAFAAFSAGIPGRPNWPLLLPLAPLAVWLGSLGQGCVESWVHAGPEGLSLQPDWECLPAIMTTGAVPAITIVVMVRRGAPLQPRLTAIFATLAAAALGNAGLRLFHPQDASLMVLIWQFGTVALLSLLSGGLGRGLFRWRHLRAGAPA